MNENENDEKFGGPHVRELRGRVCLLEQDLEDRGTLERRLEDLERARQIEQLEAHVRSERRDALINGFFWGAAAGMILAAFLRAASEDA